MSTENRAQAFSQALRRLSVLFVKIASQQSSAHHVFSKQELLTIDVLGVRGACRMGEIAEHLGVGQSAITPLVDRLEDQGIVQRRRSETDRRVWLVELTEQGAAVYAAEEKFYQVFATEMLAPLDESEQQTLIALLERIGASAQVV